MLSALSNGTFESEALQSIVLTTYGITTGIGKSGFHMSNLKSFYLTALLTSNIYNDTFQNFAHLPLHTFHLFVTTRKGSAYVVEKGAFAHLPNIVEMAITTETLPVLGSLSAPLQK